MIEACFSKIKDKLTDSIERSQSSIFIAVAWFTQRDLFNALLAALDRGVQINLILIDDIINRSEYGLDFSLFIENGGRLCLVNSRKTLMHDKFCLFDKRQIITGSYKWTYSAETRNSENVVITDDSKVCDAYVIHFSDLWDRFEKVTHYETINMSECDENSFVQNYNTLCEEIDIMVSKNVLKKDEFQYVQDLKNNIAITRLSRITETLNRKNPTLKMKIGMRCRIAGVDNKVLSIISKSHTLPFTNIVDTVTAIDNQKDVLCEIVYGDSNNADENESLAKITLCDIPQLKAGLVKFKTKLTMDTNGYIHVEYVCLNTGVAKEAVYVNSNLINYR